MSCYCPTCEDFVQPAEGGEAMSRIELYRRTKGYSIFGVVNAKMFSAAVILVVIALGLKNPQLILDSDILCVFALCGAVALFWILRYWNTGLTFSKKTLFFLRAKFFQKARCRDQMRKALGKIGGLQKRERTRRGILLFVYGR